jgi:hypothetical protein
MRRTALLVPLLLLPACGDVQVERTSQDARTTPSAAFTPAPSPSPEPVQTSPTPESSPAPTKAVAPSEAAAPAKPAAQGDVDGDGTAGRDRRGREPRGDPFRHGQGGVQRVPDRHRPGDERRGGRGP